jgi:hypothetical protein
MTFPGAVIAIYLSRSGQRRTRSSFIYFFSRGVKIYDVSTCLAMIALIRHVPSHSHSALSTFSFIGSSRVNSRQSQRYRNAQYLIRMSSSEEAEFQGSSEEEFQEEEEEEEVFEADDDSDDVPLAALKKKTNEESDSDDDIPLAALKSPPKKKKPAATKKATPKKTKTEAKAPKPKPKPKKKPETPTATSSNGNCRSPSAALYGTGCKKGMLIQRLLCRWWYAINWPVDIPQQPPKHYDSLDGMPGVFICTSGSDVGRIKDMRDKTNCPNFLNFARKSSEELKELLLTALKAQKEALVKAEGSGTSTEKEINDMIKWTEKVNPGAADKEAQKVLKAAKLSL